MKPSCDGDTVLNFSEPVRSSMGSQGVHQVFADNRRRTDVSARAVPRPSSLSMFIEVITMNHPNRVRLSKLSLGLLLALAAAPAFAQSTSAAIGGQVVGSDGQPVSGAEVTITHVESGTVSRATTDASGRYNARGLRVGGPYTVVINKAGAGSDSEEGVYLSLNQAATVDGQLNNSVTTLGTVQAVATAGTSVFSATKMGSGTSVDQNTLQALPSMGGNIQDFMRLDPRVAFTPAPPPSELRDGGWSEILE